MNEWVWFIPFKFKFSASSSASSLWSSFPSLPFESPGYWVNNITPKHSARIVFLHSGFWYVKRKVLLLLFVFVRSFVVVIVEFELNNPNKKNSWILAVCINIWMWIHISSLSFSSCPDAAQQLNVLQHHSKERILFHRISIQPASKPDKTKVVLQRHQVSSIKREDLLLPILESMIIQQQVCPLARLWMKFIHAILILYFLLVLIILFINLLKVWRRRSQEQEHLWTPRKVSEEDVECSAVLSRSVCVSVCAFRCSTKQTKKFSVKSSILLEALP